jgi:hypothetical protein
VSIRDLCKAFGGLPKLPCGLTLIRSIPGESLAIPPARPELLTRGTGGVTGYLITTA